MPARSATASSTGCTSVGDSLITRRISLVAVCRSSASFVSLNRRDVLDGNDSLVGKRGQQRHLLVRHRPRFRRRHRDGADGHPVTQQRRRSGARNASRSAFLRRVGGWHRRAPGCRRPGVLGTRARPGRRGFRGRSASPRRRGTRRPQNSFVARRRSPSGSTVRSAALRPNSRAALSHDRVEHRLRVRRRAADDAQHLGRGRLLLQRLLRFVEQARVLDRDHRLVGEGLEQAAFLLAEGRACPGARR